MALAVFGDILCSYTLPLYSSVNIYKAVGKVVKQK